MQYIATSSSVNGRIQAPASKSVAQRAIAIASLAHGTSLVDFPGDCDDVKAAIRVCRQLGASIESTGNGLKIQGGIRPPSKALNCGEAGLGIRMFSCIAAILDSDVTLTGEGSLLKRPMMVVEDSLKALGVSCHTNRGYLPLTVKGPIMGGTAKLDGSLSSQVLTGILIASPFASQNVELHVSNLKSIEYIDVTTKVMNQFGVEVENRDYEYFCIKAGQKYRPAHTIIEGDWSGAAFLLVAGAVAGHVAVDNLCMDSGQPDRNILVALRRSGARIDESENTVEVSKQALQAFDFDATNCPDLFPPLVALAANCRGESRISGAGRLRAKESDRAATLMDTFGKLGLAIRLESDTMVITGGAMKGATISSYDDHRIAMAGTIAALTATGNVVIEHAEAVNKSYPAFFDDIKKLTTDNR